MRTRVALFAMLVSGASAAEGAGIERASWLQGCWELAAGGGSVEEHWMAPRGGNMLGMGRTVRDGALVEYELVVIREQGDRLAYEAHPSGQAPAVFLSTAITASSLVFENLQHDFPQRVGYDRSAPDSLRAWIEGERDGRTRRIEFPYRRAACTTN